MGEFGAGIVVLIVLLIVNLVLYKMRQKLTGKAGPYYNLYSVEGRRLSTPDYVGKWRLRDEEIFKKGHEQLISHMAAQQHMTEEAYDAMVRDMSVDEYREVRAGKSLDDIRVKKLLAQEQKKEQDRGGDPS